jgi:hypothetical protein
MPGGLAPGVAGGLVEPGELTMGRGPDTLAAPIGRFIVPGGGFPDAGTGNG